MALYGPWHHAIVLASCVAALGCGVLVAAARPDRAQNWRLLLLLLAESTMFACGESLMYLVPDPRSTFALQVLTYALMMLLPALYLSFLATLDTPLRPLLRRRGVLPAVFVAAVTASLYLTLRSDAFVGAPYYVGNAFVRYSTRGGPDSLLPFFVLIGTLVVSALFAILARLRARDALARRQANVYLAAFLARDAFFVLATLFIIGALPSPVRGAGGLAGATGYLLFAALVAYGVLRAQLFDIDLRIKWSIRRGTLVGAFVAVFVVAAEVAQNYLSDAYGYAVGGVAAAALLLAVRPLDRMGARVADAAMPGVASTPEYLAYRKHEIYRQAVADAMLDGRVTPSERAVLDGLRRSLAIDAAVADELERAAGR